MHWHGQEKIDDIQREFFVEYWRVEVQALPEAGNEQQHLVRRSGQLSYQMLHGWSSQSHLARVLVALLEVEANHWRVLSALLEVEANHWIHLISQRMTGNNALLVMLNCLVAASLHQYCLDELIHLKNEQVFDHESYKDEVAGKNNDEQ